ncbi:MAG: radical SAM protein [Elusimicrobia bacterium]|nr:radical SAM protein [Elusimicrobiota bacterium]
MKTLDSSAFRARLERAARKRRFPLRVMLEVTYDCNFNCPHCYIPHGYRAQYRKKEITARRFCAIIDELAAVGCLQLGVTGGEPLLKKGIFTILKHARRRGMQTYLYTNASLITQATARKLKNCGCAKVDITLPAMSKKAFGAVTGAPDSHRAVLGAAGILRKEGLSLGFKTCKLKANRLELPSLRAFAGKYGAPWRLDTEHIPRLDGTPLPAEILSGKPGLSRTPACPRCGAGDVQAAITPAGELKICVAVDGPKWKIGPSSLKTLWRRLDSPKLKRALLKRCPAI